MRRPRVEKRPDGWWVLRPAYGFSPTQNEDGPFPNQPAALRSVLFPKVETAASTLLDGANEPAAHRESKHMSRMWPVVYR